MLYKEACESERLASLSDGAFRTFMLVQMFCDDLGRCRAETKLLASWIYPYGPHDADAVAGHLREMSDKKYIGFYEVEGKAYFAFYDDQWKQTPRYIAKRDLLPDPPFGNSRKLSAISPSNSNSNSKSSSKEAALFERFYSSYPLHKERGAAEKAFTKALGRAEAEEIIAGAERYRDDPTRDPKFTKHPATWLNRDCWKDEVTPAAPTRRAYTVNGQ